MRKVILENLTDKIGRRYDRTELERVAVGKSVYGELGDGSGLETNLAVVSHRFDDLRFEGDDLVGDLHVLNTPRGEIFRSLLEEKCQYWLSLRATGFYDGRGVVKLHEICGVDVLFEARIKE